MNFLPLILLTFSHFSYATVCTTTSLNGLTVGQKFPFSQSATKIYGPYTINSLSGYFSVVDGCTLGVSITLGQGDSLSSAMAIQVFGKTATGTYGFPVGTAVITGSGTINVNIPFDKTNFLVSSSSVGVSWVDISSISLFSASTAGGSGWQVSTIAPIVPSTASAPPPVAPSVASPSASFVVPAAAPAAPSQKPASPAAPAKNPDSTAATPSPSPTSDAIVTSISIITIATFLFLVAL